ncbi:MAG: MFS transporter [Pseudomonadota bacterium]
MNLRLLSLVFGPFAFGTSAFAFVGLMDPMALGLGVDVPMVGQLQTVFAIACGLGAPILARLVTQTDRKRLLIAVMLGLVGINIATALAPNYTFIAFIRIAGGLFAALTLPLATTIAVTMVPEKNRPAAIATVLAGYTLAFLIGMPLCTLLGDAFGWQAAFWFSAAISIGAAIIIAIGAPGKIAAPEMGNVGFKAALTGDNGLLMVVSLLAFTATFTTVSYIGPMITAFSGLEGAAIGWVQIATGVGSLLGLPAGAFMARLPVKSALFGLVGITFITQMTFSFGMSNDLGLFALPLLLAAMIFGSAALFATSPVIQTHLAKSAGPAATLAFALNGSMIFFGQGSGAGLGGWIAAGSTLDYIGYGGAVTAVIAFLSIALLQDNAHGVPVPAEPVDPASTEEASS